MTVLSLSPVLPWALSGEDERRFRRILVKVGVAFLGLGITIPLLQVPQIERKVSEYRVPDRVVKILLERSLQPKPVARPKPKPKPVVKAKAKPKPKPVVKAKPKPKPKPKSRPRPKPKPVAKAKPKPRPKPVAKKVAKPKPRKPVVDPQAARKKAQRSGLLAMQDTLADLRQTPNVASLGGRTRLSQSGKSSGKTTRAVLTSNVARGSGGIRTARLSRTTGGSGLSGRSTTHVESSLAAETAIAGKSRGGARKASRTIEEIQMIFDRNKAAIYAMYNRALRKDPSLQGKVVLKITIAPSGKVTACRLVSSELDAPALNQKLVQRVKLFNFGAKDVTEVTVNYPIDFLPA